ncbi:hypothetical protein ACQWTT_001265 [Acinetobacter baumannii]
MQKLNATKTVNTQAIINIINAGFCFSKMKNVFVVNEHTSCPDHNNNFHVYRDINAVYFALQFKGKMRTSAACTVTQFPSVDKRCPINTIRLSKDGSEVYTQSLFAYNKEFDIKVRQTAPLPKFEQSGLTQAEYNLLVDWIKFRTDRETSNLVHKRGLGLVKINSVLKLAESYLSYEVSAKNTY